MGGRRFGMSGHAGGNAARQLALLLIAPLLATSLGVASAGRAAAGNDMQPSAPQARADVQPAQAQPSLSPARRSATRAGAATGSGTNDYLPAVSCISASNCWAVGYYNEAAYSSANAALIEHSTGSSWSIVTGPTQLQGMMLSGVACLATGVCWAVGSYTATVGSQTLIEYYNGSAWSVVSSPNANASYPSSLTAVTCVSASDCWAVGTGGVSGSGYSDVTLAEHYDGSVWSIVSTPNPSTSDVSTTAALDSVSCAATGFCVAVGAAEGCTFPGGCDFKEIAEFWNGVQWTINSPSDYNWFRIALNAVVCASSSWCSAVGYTCECLFGNQLTDLWNGTSWGGMNVNQPGWPSNNNTFTFLWGLSCVSSSFCSTVGYFNGAPVTAAWNGSAWTVLSTPGPSSGSNAQLYGVSCVSSTACTAVGEYFTPGGAQTLIYEYNGTSWSLAGSPNVQGALTGGPVLAPELYGAANCACANASLAQSYAGEPVDTAYGNFTETMTDLSIPGRGIPLQFSRTYNSLNASANGPLGYGWSSNLLISLNQPGGSGPVTISQEGGAQVVFNPSGSTYVPAAARVIATLTHNSDGTWTFTRDVQDTFTFSASGQLISEADRNGYVTKFGYKTSNQLATVTDPENRILQVGWTGSNITSITDANVTPSRVVTMQYANGDLTDVIDVNGGHTHLAYTNHQLTNVFDPRCLAAQLQCNGGNGAATHYNGSGQVDYQIDQLGRKTQFSYAGTPSSASGGTTTVTDPKGNVTLDTYQYGLLTAQTRGYGTPDAATWQYTYDPATAVRVSTVDPNGHLTTSSVDASGNVLSTTDAMAGRPPRRTTRSMSR